MKKVSSNPKDKYLYINSNEIFLRFRLPKCLGGAILKKSLKTTDPIYARKLRDEFIVPILSKNSISEILQDIQEQIAFLQSDTSSLEYYDLNVKKMFFNDAIEIYLNYLTDIKKNKPSTIKGYRNYLKVISNLWGNIELNQIQTLHSKKLRDYLINENLSTNTISHYFKTLRSFLHYLYKDKIFDTRKIVEQIDIQLPKVTITNTAMIEPQFADSCMRCVPEWEIAPTIARYTGMRSGEILACCSNYAGCGIKYINKVKCFFISKQFAKTHAERYVPIIDKLLPSLTKENLLEVSQNARFNGILSPKQKKYNRAVKKVPNCKNVSFHSWRVYANTMMMEAGVDELLCCRILGHKMAKNIHYGYTAGRIEAMKKALELIP